MKQEYRIRIRGGSCSGKSTMAKYLGNFLNISSVIHLDDIYWLPGWKSLSFEELNEITKKRIKGKKNWVMDGNYRSMGEELTGLATHVIIMHPPIYKQLWRMFWREVIRKSKLKFLNVSPIPSNISEDDLNDPFLEILNILGKQAISYYKSKAKWTYQMVKRDFPNVKIFVYQDKRASKEKLKEFLSQD